MSPRGRLNPYVGFQPWRFQTQRLHNRPYAHRSGTGTCATSPCWGDTTPPTLSPCGCPTGLLLLAPCSVHQWMSASNKTVRQSRSLGCALLLSVVCRSRVDQIRTCKHNWTRQRFGKSNAQWAIPQMQVLARYYRVVPLHQVSPGGLGPILYLSVVY